jgi:hypothetical protein
LYVRAGAGRAAGVAVNAIKWHRVFAVVAFAPLTLVFTLGCIVGADPDEAELDAARTRTKVDEAAKRYQRAKAELKALEEPAETPKRRPSRGSRSAAASS